MKALIENIQHYCLHDGPGIRTTVFFKGCPLRCLWCSNPSTQNVSKELIYKTANCLVCGRCASLCPQQAIAFIPGSSPSIDRTRCTQCGMCSDTCPGKALVMAGTEYGLEDVLSILKQDIMFYRNSGGGVTFSGGEVLSQYQFALALGQRCQHLGINTAMETSGCGSYQHLYALAAVMDHIFFDIKHLDDMAHIQLTGQSNQRILENLRRLAHEQGDRVRIHLRLPLIPNMNDNPDHLERYGLFAEGVAGIADLEILPYHRLGKDKYTMLGREYALEHVAPFSHEAIAAAVASVRTHTKRLRVLCAV